MRRQKKAADLNLPMTDKYTFALKRAALRASLTSAPHRAAGGIQPEPISAVFRQMTFFLLDTSEQERGPRRCSAGWNGFV